MPGPAGLPNNVWARGFGQFGSIDSNGGALGADYSTGGGAIGADLIRTPQSLLGIAASGGQSTFTTNSLPESGTISFVQFGVYGAQMYNYGLAHDFYDVNRGIVLPGLSRTASSSYGGDDVALDVGVSRPWQYDAWQITPRVGLSYFLIGQDTANESGAGSLDLTVDPAALDSLRSRAGVTVSQPMMMGGMQFLPELRAAWTHEFMDNHGSTLAFLAGAPANGFTQQGALVGRDAADLGAGASFAIAQTTLPGQLSAFVQYDASIAAHQTNNAVAAGLKLNW
jgi:outer membrane autotransporter protein